MVADTTHSGHSFMICEAIFVKLIICIHHTRYDSSLIFLLQKKKPLNTRGLFFELHVCRENLVEQELGCVVRRSNLESKNKTPLNWGTWACKPCKQWLQNAIATPTPKVAEPFAFFTVAIVVA